MAVLLALPAVAAGQTKPCIAYLNNGELRADCGGKDIMLLRKRGLAAFAIGVDGGTVLGGVGGNGRRWAFIVRRGVWTKLRVSAETSANKIYRACGSALAPYGVGAYVGQPTVDVISGTSADIAGLRWPQCSADRSLIIGINARGELATNQGKVLDGAVKYPVFSVSPSGRWVALLRSMSGQLCISDTLKSSSRCFSRDAEGREGTLLSTSTLSTNDAGDVLVEQVSGGTCWYADGATAVSRMSFPGAGPDQCYGVGVAGPTSAPRVIIPVGSRPVWVDQKLLQNLFSAVK